MTKDVKVKVNRPPFAMVSKFIFDYITDANAIKLYLGLYTWADGDGNCYPTFTQIEERIKMSRATISKSINILKREGLLIVRKGKKSGNLKANNIYQLETNLHQKAPIFPSSNSKLEESSPSSNSKLESSSNSKLSLVQELNYNENQLMIINNNNQSLEKGEKYSKSKLIKSVELQKEFFKEKLKDFINKYTRDQLNEFYKFWTLPCDVTGETRFAKVLKSKDKNFVFANRLANAKRMGHLDKPKSNQANQPKTFDEMHRDATSEATKRFAMKEYNLTSEEYDEQFNNFNNKGLYYADAEQLGIN